MNWIMILIDLRLWTVRFQRNIWKLI